MDDEKVILEARANTTYVLLGFPAVPLWLVLLLTEKIRGQSYFYAVKMTYMKLFQDYSFLIFLFVLELLVFLAYLRIRSQRVVLTDEKLIIYQLKLFGTKFLETTRQELKLTEIEKIYVRTGSDFFEKRLKCSTIFIEPKGDKEIPLNLMNNGREFTNKASYQVAMAKKQATI